MKKLRDHNLASFNSLHEAVQHTSELLIQIPEGLNQSGVISPEIASRVVDYRAQVTSIKEVIKRRQLKVAFFGRTSSGKSTVINALLGEKILPTGLGHTTDKFVHVQGTKSSKASIIANDDIIEIDTDAQSIPWTDIKSSTIDLHYPRHRSKLLNNDDVIFLDSPGVDVEVNFDEWIDEYCADADLFIFVLNSESTLMMREKSFFHSVSRKIAKPNILILFNRWDCTDSEDEAKSLLVKEQHLKKACEFLVHELNVAANVNDASNQVYFVSAKEALENKVENERSETWSRFCTYIDACLEMAGKGAKFGPLIDAGRLVAHDLDNIQGHIYVKAKDLHEEKVQEKLILEEKLNQVKDLINQMTKDWKEQGQNDLTRKVDEIVSNAFKVEVEDALPNLIYEFHGTLINDEPDMIKVYKKSLWKHLEHSFLDSLQSRLSLQLLFCVENQRSLFKNGLIHIASFGETSLKWPPLDDLSCIQIPESIELDGQAFIEDPVSFSFSLDPQKLYEKWLKNQPLSHKDPNWPLWTQILMVTESQLAIAGFVFRYFNKSKVLMKILISISLCYGSLYVIERFSWSYSGKERQIKTQALELSTCQINAREKFVRSSMMNQIKNNLNGYLSVLISTVEFFVSELNDNLEKLEQEVCDLQHVISTCANLSSSLQGVLFDFDTSERILLQSSA